ncbi:hypothetical protein [Ruminococcus gauvreauii]|uniref:hypothetical protein n=1 Tax=Ruminococcus gauvreauii TaxID=438033 RepID=UPI003984466F
MKTKKKRWHRILLAGLLAVALMGCSRAGSGQMTDAGQNTGGNAGNTADAKGRYVETQLPAPDGFSGVGSIGRLQDGRLILIDKNEGIKFTSDDGGKTWSTETLTELKTLTDQDADITGTAVAPDGGIFISYILWEESTSEKTYPEKYIYLDADGTVHHAEFGLEDYKTSVIDAVITADGRVFVITNSYDVYELDVRQQTYQKLFTPDEVRDVGLYACGNSLVVQDGQKAYFYNLESGELNTPDEVLNSFIGEQTEQKAGIAMCASDDKDGNQTLYLAAAGGIYGHVLGGSVMEQLADGALTNLGDPSKTPAWMSRSEDGSFLIYYHDGALYSYVYDPDISAVPEQLLTVYTLYDNETVRQAISCYRTENPDTFIRLEIGVSEKNGVTANDAVKNLNTQLLAGKGPDMILLNGMPADAYIEKGILMDLSDFVAELPGNYFEGILKGYQSEEGIFILPFRFDVPLLTGNESWLSQISDLKSLADTAEAIADSPETEESVLGSYTATELLEKLYLTSAGTWTSDDGNVNEDSLQEFLTQAKRIYEAEQKNLDEEELSNHQKMYDEFLAYYQDDQRAKENLLSNGPQSAWQIARRQVLTAGLLCSMSDLNSILAVNRQMEGNTYRAFNGQSSDVFSPSGIIGVSVNSENQELAMSWLETLLGTEVQSKDLRDGFPVNAEAFDSFATNPNPGTTEGAGLMDRDGNEIRLDVVWPDDAEKKQFRDLIETLKVPAVTDDSLKEEIIAIGAQALTGEKEIEDCTGEILQKISIHLQE